MEGIHTTGYASQWDINAKLRCFCCRSCQQNSQMCHGPHTATKEIIKQHCGCWNFIIISSADLVNGANPMPSRPSSVLPSVNFLSIRIGSNTCMIRFFNLCFEVDIFSSRDQINHCIGRSIISCVNVLYNKFSLIKTLTRKASALTL